MLLATADATASIRIRFPGYTYPAMRNLPLVEQYARLFAPPVRYLSDYRPEAFIYVPAPIKPQWLMRTEARIRASVAPDSRGESNDGRWLRAAVADSANIFFQNTADLLPGEPFIYSSRLGDLVAEFKAEHGTMTSILSPTFALLFAVIGGIPVERRVAQGSDAREAVRQLTEMLRTGHYGSVDTRK
jgi:hypothetical protein